MIFAPIWHRSPMAVESDLTPLFPSPQWGGGADTLTEVLKRQNEAHVASFHEQMHTGEGVQQLVKEWWDAELELQIASELSTWYIDSTDWRIKHDLAEGWHITATRPYVWLKMQLLEFNLLPNPGPPLEDDPPSVTSATLHVGFLTLTETEEMLLRLHFESLTDKIQPARSKMFATAEKQDVFPINAIAAKVASSK